MDDTTDRVRKGAREKRITGQGEREVGREREEKEEMKERNGKRDRSFLEWAPEAV